MSYQVKSKYSIIGGFGLLLVSNLLFIFLAYRIFTTSNISWDKVGLFAENRATILYVVTSLVCFTLFILFQKECKRIIVESDGITFINPVFPFLRKKKLWTEFDFYFLVQEEVRNKRHEAVWLVKNSKLENRISSFYYTNFSEVEKAIKVKKERRRRSNPISHFLMVLRLKKVRDR